MSSSVAANATGSSRFKLPALNLNFGNITDGTDIPPPPASPVEKEKPLLAETSKEKLGAGAATKTEEATAASKPAATPSATNGNLAGSKRPADAPPSPSASHRTGSIRRMFSRTKLNNSDPEDHSVSNGGAAASINGSRPVSRSGTSILDERVSRRASGWFKRLRGGDSKRSSLSLESTATSTAPTTTSTAPAAAKPSGPPPPMIPELKEFSKDEGSLGNDLFKNIK